MEFEQRVRDAFNASIDTKAEAIDVLPAKIAIVGEQLVQALIQGKKLLTCGNGGSAGDAQHLSSELLNRYERERPPLPAISLNSDVATITAIANDYDYSQVYVKQIQALGQPGDILVVFTTSGNSKNILSAVGAAHEKGLRVLAITGKNGGELRGYLSSDDLELCVPSSVTARIQEVHLLIIHSLCDIIDHALFGHIS